MTWFEAKRYINSCKLSWQILKQEFNGKEREILEQAYLVVDYHAGQIELSKLTLECIALHHSHLLRQSYFIGIVKKKIWLIEQNQKHQNGKFQKDLEWIERHIKNVEPKIELNSFTIEVRFQQLNFELIQKLKNSDHCDKTRTEMSRINIRVILKGRTTE